MWSIGFEGANPDYPGTAARPEKPLLPGGLLEKAHELGLRLVQTGPNLGLEKLSEAGLGEFIQMAKDWQIDLELGTRGLDADHLARQVALARRMGAKLIRSLPELEGKPVNDPRLITRALRQILPLLEREGIRLALENGRIPAADLRAILDDLHSPFVGVVLDMVNSLAVPEGWKEVTRCLAPHTMCLHYKDFTIRRAWHMMGFIVEGAPAGRGMVDTGWLLQELEASPYDFNVLVELWPPEQETISETEALEQAWAVESLAYLRNYIKD
jgi:sugar phosphate isomerase/epimerase